ncbi:MAG TPA: 3-deoxy-manno-octulosonate cytidylyltransferase [Pirellulaceae bacterium]|nr:3-deoxy-manno-octulosonate cytidylyltransferase [Pirellulaceae bacterium]
MVIPARLGSTRLPRKMLLAETGMTLLEHTYRSAKTSLTAERVVIATDDASIVQVAEGFGADAVLTDLAHQSGTERVAEVAHGLSGFDLVVNLQGDEPEMAGEVIDKAVEVFQQPDVQVSTVACPIRERALLDDPSCVKVVLDHQGRALYFSRSVIPYPRQWDDSLLSDDRPVYLQHLGLYVYRRDFLTSFAKLPDSPLARCESLEQLRVLQAGHSIRVALVSHSSKGIDTPEDYAAFVSRFRQNAAVGI